MRKNDAKILIGLVETEPITVTLAILMKIANIPIEANAKSRSDFYRLKNAQKLNVEIIKQLKG